MIAEALAGVRGTDPASDLQARVVARAAWSATRAAREIWVASDGKRDPRRLVNEAFDLLNRGFQRDQAERMDEP